MVTATFAAVAALAIAAALVVGYVAGRFAARDDALWGAK